MKKQKKSIDSIGIARHRSEKLQIIDDGEDWALVAKGPKLSSNWQIQSPVKQSTIWMKNAFTFRALKR